MSSSKPCSGNRPRENRCAASPWLWVREIRKICCAIRINTAVCCATIRIMSKTSWRKCGRPGKSYIDPFAEKRRRAGRKNRDMGEMAMELIASLSKLGKDGEAIVSSLYEIFCRASGNMAESDAETPRELSRLRSENARLERELEQLHQSKKQLAEELAKQAALGSELERRLSTLESLNRGFVTLAGMEKISGLSDYVTAITRCIGPQDSGAH